MMGVKHIVVIVLISFVEFASSSKSKTFDRLPLGPNRRGPESIAFDCKGEGPYVGISDGRILKWEGRQIGWIEFAVTSPNRPSWCNGVYRSPAEKVCGRPLGLNIDLVTCEMYITDPSFGLVKVGPKGGIATSLVSGLEGKRFKFLNNLDIDSKKRAVYFTDSTTKYYGWEGEQALNDTGDRSGRFMKYDIKTGSVTVLLKHLSFANGVSLSQKKDFVLVGETNARKIIKYWLTGSKAGSYDAFLRFSRGPNNINRNAEGNFWIAVQSAQSIKVNKFGKILASLSTDEIGDGPSEVEEFKSCILVGSIDERYILHSCKKNADLDV